MKVKESGQADLLGVMVGDILIGIYVYMYIYTECKYVVYPLPCNL